MLNHEKTRPMNPEHDSMNTQQPVNDVFLFPGGLYFGDRHTRIRTVLGSCVSVVFWHPEIRAGGMCHFMLPSRNIPAQIKDGRYADEAIELLLQNIDTLGAPRAQYQVKLFGGGDMFGNVASGNADISVGLKNIRAARSLIGAHGFQITHEHLGGSGHRVIRFDISSGEVQLKHIPVPAPGTISPTASSENTQTRLEGGDTLAVQRSAPSGYGESIAKFPGNFK
jgi:chemotaxis protein CheD